MAVRSFEEKKRRFFSNTLLADDLKENVCLHHHLFDGKLAKPQFVGSMRPFLIALELQSFE